MRLLKWLIALLAVCIIVVLVYYATAARSAPPASVAQALTPAATITLDMTIIGGFTYLYSTQRKVFDVVYLNEVTNGECHVIKTDVRLKVLDGTIASPSPPPADNSFGLDGAVVTFENPATGSATGRGPGDINTQNHPTNPDNQEEWADLKFVPNVFQKFPGHSVDPNWRNLPVVNGHVVLSSGTLKGAKPTDPTAVPEIWDFKKKNAPGPPLFSQAMTNETLYSTKLSGASVTITLTRGANVTTVVVTPNNHHVQLSLTGAHDDAPLNPPAGTPVDDFCGYYELLTPPLAVADRLLPHSTQPVTPPNGPTQPVPGPLCGGDYGGQP